MHVYVIAAAVTALVATTPVYGTQTGLDTLSEEPHWLTLCHYRETPAGYVSEIDAPGFFLSPRGRTSPQEELEAAYTAFFVRRDTDAISRFPAR
ncbi:MAG: hypothetical protein ACOC2H_05740, partial [Spirochaetota bacterium]